MNFDIKNYAVIKLGGIQILINETIFTTWIIMGVLIIFAIFVRIKMRKFKEVPKGLQNVVEALVELFENYLHTTVGDKLMFLGNWFFTLFIFILISNLSGMIPGLRSPTADWSMTVGLAIVTFLLTQIIGVMHRKGGYVKDLFKPVFLFLPINIIGELARPISISFRLFGNMLAGLIMMSLIYTLFPVIARFIIPAFLHTYFDLFAGVLQTYIFCTLSLSFISSSAAIAEE